MIGLDRKYVAGAVVLAAIGAFIFLRARRVDERPVQVNVVGVPPPADDSEERLVPLEPVRQLVPLIPPDAEVEDGGSFVVVGRVIDEESGEPIVGASIEHAPMLATGTEGTVESDENGEFRFEVSMKEPERMSVSAPGHARISFESIDAARPARKTSGEVVRLEEIRLRRGVQPIVHVLDEQGKPVAGARLVLCESPAFGSQRTTRELGRTDEKGEWAATESLAGATQATFVLAGRDGACGYAPLALQAQGSKGEPLEIALHPAVDLEVRALTQGPVGLPLAGVSIQVSFMTGGARGLWLATRKLYRSGGGTSGWLGAKTGADGSAHLWIPNVTGLAETAELTATSTCTSRSTSMCARTISTSQ